MELGWGIVGIGWAADALVGPAISANPDSRIVAAVSRDDARARAFADKHKVPRTYTRYEAMLDDPTVQVVYIASPNAMHVDQTIAAAHAGKHVLCEKPLAMNVTDAMRSVDACQSAHVKLGTNFQTRHYAANAHAKRLIEDGVIGDIVIFNCESCAGASPLKGWRMDQSLAGHGATNNLAVHSLDLVRYLVRSEFKDVVAMTDVGGSDELETVCLTMMRLENGTLAYVNGNQKVPYPRADMEIYGSKGRIIGHNTTRPFMDGELRVLTQSGEKIMPFSTRDGFERAVADFNRAVLDDRVANASGEDGLRSVELVDAIVRSAREGKLVEVATATLERSG